MLIYEKEWANQQSKFLSYTVKNLSWHLHFHAAFEICFVLCGVIEITVDGALYTLKKDDAIIIFPRQLHSYKTIEHSNMRIITFIPALAPEFMSHYSNKLPINNTVRSFIKYKDLFDGNNTFLQKGLLYSVLGELVETTKFTEAPVNEDTILINKALRYIEKNYSTDCTLASASEEISYGYSYLSRTFKRIMGMSFTEYLNRFRINHAVYLLSSGNNYPISHIAQLCGYDSLCSFNRNFKRITGTTPRNILLEIKPD